MKFKLHIKMGNDGMQTYEDVRDALLVVAERLIPYKGEPFRGARGKVRDDNGNTVGEWEFRGES